MECMVFLRPASLPNNQLIHFLSSYGYAPVRHTPGLWCHTWHTLSFCLVVDDFGVKYIGKEHADHLIQCLCNQYQEVDIDWNGNRFCGIHLDWDLIQFPPEMDENWVRYGLAKLGQISRLPNWQRMLFCAYTTQLLHSTGEVCWNNNDSYFIWFEFVCRNSGQIASRRSWKRSCLGLEYTSKCSRLALLWEPN